MTTWNSLEHTSYDSYEMKNDRDIVMAAVKQERFALEYATSELQNDRDVVGARRPSRTIQKGCIMKKTINYYLGAPCVHPL